MVRRSGRGPFKPRGHVADPPDVLTPEPVCPPRERGRERHRRRAPRVSFGAAVRLGALVPAVGAVLLVGAAVEEARRAAVTDIPCLGSIPTAVGIAAVAFAAAVVAVRLALEGAWAIAGRVLVEDLARAGVHRPAGVRARHWAVLAPLLGALCFAPVAAAGGDEYPAPRPVALLGYADGAAQPPQPGAWMATGAYRFSDGLGGRRGRKITRPLEVRRECSAGRCALTLTRHFEEPGARLTARLVRHADGWHARFPPQPFACMDDESRVVGMRSHWVLHFRDGGRTLEARERIFLFERGCQYRNALVEWFAMRPAPPRSAQPGDPV